MDNIFFKMNKYFQLYESLTVFLYAPYCHLDQINASLSGKTVFVLLTYQVNVYHPMRSE